jgi:hypothetical protein
MPRTLPFRPEFWGPITTGRKTVTSRTRKFGEPGDLLDTSVGPVRLLEVFQTTLEDVRDHLWTKEGVHGPNDFERVWKEIHPRKGFDPAQEVWVHRFEYIGRDAKTDSDDRKGKGNG